MKPAVTRAARTDVPATRDRFQSRAPSSAARAAFAEAALETVLAAGFLAMQRGCSASPRRPTGPFDAQLGKRNRKTPWHGGLRKSHAIRSLPETARFPGSTFDVREELTVFNTSGGQYATSGRPCPYRDHAKGYRRIACTENPLFGICPSLRSRRGSPCQVFHRGCRRDLSLAGVPGRVSGDPRQIVQIVHHHPRRFRDARFGKISTGTDRVHRCTVSKMKAGNRIQRKSVRRLGLQQVFRGETLHVLRIVALACDALVGGSSARVRGSVTASRMS